jgi:hypothetical protein
VGVVAVAAADPDVHPADRQIAARPAPTTTVRQMGSLVGRLIGFAGRAHGSAGSTLEACCLRRRSIGRS